MVERDGWTAGLKREKYVIRERQMTRARRSRDVMSRKASPSALLPHVEVRVGESIPNAPALRAAHKLKVHSMLSRERIHSV